MKITFLGTGHGRAEPDRFHASALVTVGDSHYMIDAGAPVSTLFLKEGGRYESLKGVFITHSHIDHCIGLVGMVNQIKTKYPDANVPVYVPDRVFCDPLMTFLSEVKKKPNALDTSKPISAKKKGQVEFIVYPDGEIFNDGTARIISVPVNHYPNAHAFIFEAEGKRICFTGDMKRDLSDYPKQLFEEDFDLVVCEAAHNRLDDPNTQAIIAQSRTKRFFINHINEARNTPEMVDSLRKAVAEQFPVTVTYDGMSVEI